ncbi:MAG: hypothetical protein AB2693_33260 [Candidatus Thiodiazotropha sp.]
MGRIIALNRRKPIDFFVMNFGKEYGQMYIHLFNFQIYTDQQHWLNGGNTRTHLYNTMENFLYQCYGKVTQREKEEAEMSEKDDEVEE